MQFLLLGIGRVGERVGAGGGGCWLLVWDEMRQDKSFKVLPFYDRVYGCFLHIYHFWCGYNSYGNNFGDSFCMLALCMRSMWLWERLCERAVLQLCCFGPNKIRFSNYKHSA